MCCKRTQNGIDSQAMPRYIYINPIQDGPFRGCSRIKAVIPYLKKIQKHINLVTHPLSSADISIFLLEISKFCYIKKYR